MRVSELAADFRPLATITLEFSADLDVNFGTAGLGGGFFSTGAGGAGSPRLLALARGDRSLKSPAQPHQRDGAHCKIDRFGDRPCVRACVRERGERESVRKEGTVEAELSLFFTDLPP